MSIKTIIQALEDAVADNENVIIEGSHGVGKTEVIKGVFTKHFGDKWAYFSGPTMDPFLDFIGCPKERTEVDEDGKSLSFIELIKPERFARDEVEAIFIDEYNRASKEIRNAVMELLQFKSINGKRFNNLKVIWTAINPPNGIYDAEPLDPAQYDRFEVHLKFPSKPERSYFKSKFGKTVADGALEWWNQLDDEKKISPRRLEKVLNAVINNKRPADRYLTAAQGPAKLLEKIKTSPGMEELSKCKTPDDYRAFFADPNKFSEVEAIISDQSKLVDYIIYMPKETASKLISGIPISDVVDFTSAVTATHFKSKEDIKFFLGVIENITNSKTNKEMAETLKSAVESCKTLVEAIE